MKHKRTPCIGVCLFVGEKKWCVGCGRTRKECKQWNSMKSSDKNILIKELKKRILKIKNKEFENSKISKLN